MEKNETQNYFELVSGDENGDFRLRILKNKPIQIQLSSHNEFYETYINVDKKELFEIRNMIDNVISPIPSNGRIKYLGRATTIGQLKKLIADYPDETSFGFQNQPMQQLIEVTAEDQKFVVFNELG